MEIPMIRFCFPAGAAAALCLALATCTSFAAEEKAGRPAAGAKKPSSQQIARGRYLLVVGSCNDCHTAGFAPSDGKVPEKEWLLGDGVLGFRGP